MFDHCPGSRNLRTPTLAIRRCPQCGEEIEIFSSDRKVACGHCGFVIYNDLVSCVQWCKFARECVGEETYRKLVHENKGGEGKVSGKG
ncbi:MAG: transposase [Methanomicrobiales archaeon]|nr:transposase [Methanomicrobiales archaeon]